MKTKWYCFACKQAFCVNVDRANLLESIHYNDENNGMREPPKPILKIPRCDKDRKDMEPYCAQYSCFHYHHEDHLDAFWRNREDESISSYQYPSSVVVGTDANNNVTDLLTPDSYASAKGKSLFKLPPWDFLRPQHSPFCAPWNRLGLALRRCQYHCGWMMLPCMNIGCQCEQQFPPSKPIKCRTSRKL